MTVASRTTDAEAAAEIDSFVAAGHINGTWAEVAMSSGLRYRVENQDGEAEGYCVDEQGFPL